MTHSLAFTPVIPDEVLHAWGELYESERLSNKLPFITFISRPRELAVRYGVYLFPDVPVNF